MNPTYSELELELHQTKAELNQTKSLLEQTRELLKKAFEEVGKLCDEVTKLKEQIARNSKKSSKPPSSDQKGNTGPNQSKKERKKRKGKTRTPFPPERVDCSIQCSQENCPHCGSSAIQLNGQLPEILQQAELPEIKATVTEYQLLKYGCIACGKNSVAPLPVGVPDSAFGPKLMGLLVTLTGVFHLAKREAVLLIKELYGVDMGVGSVSNIEERVSEALDPIYQRIHSFVIESKFCKHFDETGWRDGGKRHFVWLAYGMANGSDDLFKLSQALLDDFDKLWTFTKTPGMEPTNNLAERDLRKLVIWRRKSYGTRSARGKRFVERITTVAQTLKRRSQSILSFIQEVIVGFYNKAATPFIFEALGF